MQDQEVRVIDIPGPIALLLSAVAFCVYWWISIAYHPLAEAPLLPPPGATIVMSSPELEHEVEARPVTRPVSR